MEDRSLSRREVVVGSLAFGAGLLAGCGLSSVGPEAAAAKPVAFLSRRLRVRQALSLSSPRPVSPLEALELGGHNYQTVSIDGKRFLTGINGVADVAWIFLVDGLMPDLSGESVVTRLGKTPIASRVEARHHLPSLRAGTIGLTLATTIDETVDPPSVETKFLPVAGQGTVLITWLQVGLLQPDLV